MPAQPLSSFTSEYGFTFGGNARLVSQRPELAVLAMEAIASWASVEGMLLNLYLAIIGGKDNLAATAYLALDGQGPKTAAMHAIAAAALKPAHHTLYRALSGWATTQQKTRDKLAHHQWGVSETIPDALLLIDPRVTIHWKPPEFRRDTQDAYQASLVALDKWWEDVFPNRGSQVFVWRKADFEEQIETNNRLALGIGNFTFVVQGHPADQEGELFAELCKVPEVQERLDRQNQSA